MLICIILVVSDTESLVFESSSVPSGSSQRMSSPPVSSSTSLATSPAPSPSQPPKATIGYDIMLKLWEAATAELSDCKLNVLPLYCYAYLSSNTARDHPAADLDIPPHCLLTYAVAASKSVPRFTDWKFVDSPIGRAFREWNSRIGISPAAWLLISSSAAMCTSCMRMFSMDGYRDHIVDGNCTYCSGELAASAQIVRGMCYVHTFCLTLLTFRFITAPLHPASDSGNPPYELQKYHLQPSFSLFDVPDHIQSAIGRALLEWNSHLGVSWTVWHTVSTARVYCPACDLVRSFEGDTDHRKVGKCGLAGLNKQSLREAKGKGRAVLE
jgi:hypothetical protein